MGTRNQSLVVLNEVVLLIVLVVSLVVIGATLAGVSVSRAVDTVAAPVDRSLSGIVGGSATVQTAYRPSMVAVASPSNRGYVDPGIVTFSWQANTETDGVDRYKLTVEKYISLKYFGFWVPAGSKGVHCSMGLTCTTTSATLPLEGSYRWKVRAHNGAGWGPSSGFHYFYAR